MNGREAFEERFGFKAKGEFRVRAWFEIPLTIAALVLMVFGSAALFNFMSNPYTAFGGTFGALPFAVALWVIICWWIVRIAHMGAVCRYIGNDDEFQITDQNKHTEVLYYPDITAVDYKPIRYLNKKLRGYTVTIHTKYRSIVYQYIAYGKQRITGPEDTPFFILEQHCGLTRDIELSDNNESRT